MVDEEANPAFGRRDFDPVGRLLAARAPQKEWVGYGAKVGGEGAVAQVPRQAIAFGTRVEARLPLAFPF